jgi:3-oxoacyl-[acyl-carrier-protein] synthase II
MDRIPDDQRIVVTGLGAITPVGHDVDSSWEAFIAGRSGIGRTTRFDAEGMGFSAKISGEVKDFDPTTALDRKTARRSDRVTQFALVAAREALTNAGLLGDDGRVDPSKVQPERIGCFIGSGVGGVGTLAEAEAVRLERGQRRVSPLAVPMVLIDSTPGAVAIEHNLRASNVAHVSACASGANSIGEAAEAIRRGVADVMVAGGAEAAIIPVTVAGFQNMGALSSWDGDPAKGSRPFDLHRDGFVMGEGAGILILERLDAARARGATVYAELAGYGTTCDAGHITAPSEDGDGILRAIDQAMEQSGLTPDDVDYVNAHGTSTPLNDKAETLAMKRLFGARASHVPISSTKSMIGHLLGAGGAVEAIACCKVIETGILPPTINLETPDPDCDLDYVPNTARETAGVDVVLSNSLGFGGHNVTLLFRKIS